MALVNNRTMTAHDERAERGDDNQGQDGPGPGGQPTKRVYLVAAFSAPTGSAPADGMAEHVVAVIGMDGDRQRFEWVGDDQSDSITNPALVTPVRVRLGLPSPWHPDDAGMVTGLVQLAPEQLGDGTVDDDLDHLLSELARSRGSSPTTRQPEVG